MLAKNVNVNAALLVHRGALRFFASKLAPTAGADIFVQNCLKDRAAFTAYDANRPPGSGDCCGARIALVSRVGTSFQASSACVHASIERCCVSPYSFNSSIVGRPSAFSNSAWFELAA